MSVAVKRWANRQKIADPTLTAVLIAIAGACDPSGTCGLSQVEIARRAGIGERACRNALGALADLDVIHRAKRGRAAEGGRLADLITFAVDRSFDLSREDVQMCRKPSAYNRHQDAGNPVRICGTVPVVRTLPEGRRAYKERARTFSSNVYDLNSMTGALGEVWFEERISAWRARIHYQGLKLELGSHECEDLAKAEIRVHDSDIEHALTSKTGTPRQPAHRPDLENLNGAALYDWLNDERKDDEQGRREAAGHGVEGTSSLAGFGAEPHGSKDSA